MKKWKIILPLTLLLCLVGIGMSNEIKPLLSEGASRLGALWDKAEEYVVGFSRTETIESGLSTVEGISDEVILTPLMEENRSLLWGRGQLTPGQQEDYDRLSQAVAVHQETAVPVESGSEEIMLVLTALRIDHPEYFWFDGEASYLQESNMLGKVRSSCTLSYTMSRGEAEGLVPLVEGYARECMGQLGNLESDYDRILGVYRYIITRTDYVLSEKDQSFISVMADQRGTCAGYSRTFQYLMHQMGVDCTLALGTDASGESHGWNIVKCDGQWYHVDVTWGDPVDAEGNPGTSLLYTYCMITDDEIRLDHFPDGRIPMPVCTATADNYYRRAGLQLSWWDMDAYRSLLEDAVLQGERELTVRFDTREAYDAAMAVLVDQTELMTLLMDCGVRIPEEGVSYVRDDEFYIFSVSLQ